MSLSRGFVIAYVVSAALSSQTHAELMITEVVDGTLPGGQPKWVEIKNSGASSVDLSAYSFGNFSNGGTSLGGGAAAPLTGSLDPLGIYIISYEATPSPPEPGEPANISVFEDVYGFAPDFFMGGGFVNGNDTLALFLGAATGDGSDADIVDLYGRIGEDGAGTEWEYTDSYAYRLPTVLGPASTFAADEWFIAGPDALEDPNGDDQLERESLLSVTTPGTHNMIPEPSTVGLALIAALALAAAARQKK
ncbi:MAG: hypothetical protein AAF961_14095 [Planctomycetota bacterium]